MNGSADHPNPVAFVTGASRGIGRAAALALAEKGHDLVISARTVREGDGRAVAAATKEATRVVPVGGSLETTAREITDRGRRVAVVPIDLTDRGSVEAAAGSAIGAWGRIDVLVNNGIYQGPGALDRVMDIDLDVLELMIRADFVNQLLLTQRVLPSMLARGAGCVINMISAAGRQTPPGPAGEGGWGLSYAAAKAAMGRITPLVHVEHGAQGIRVYDVDPGFVLNERMIALGSGDQYTRLQHVGRPETVGAVIAWLACSPEGRRFDGQIVHAQPLCAELGLLGLGDGGSERD